MEIAEEKYRTGEFVLEPGEVSFKQMSVSNEDDTETSEWCEF